MSIPNCIHRWCRTGLPAFLAGAATLGIAQPQTPAEDVAPEGMLGSSALRDTADGVLKACGLKFAALRRVLDMPSETYLRIDGVFLLSRHPTSGVGYALKLGVRGVGTGSAARAPWSAYLRAPDGSEPTPPARLPTSDPATALFAGILDRNMMAAYTGIANTGKAVLGFNLAPGQLDLTVPLDFTVSSSRMSGARVVRQHSGAAVADFARCSSELFDQPGQRVR